MLVGASLSNLSTSTMQEGTSPLNPPSKGGNLRRECFSRMAMDALFRCKDEDKVSKLQIKYELFMKRMKKS